MAQQDINPAVDSHLDAWVKQESMNSELYAGIGGGGGGGLRYTHAQGSAASTWTVVHNLGARPQVMVVDSSGDVVWGDVHHTSTSQLEIEFGAVFSGTAYLDIGGL